MSSQKEINLSEKQSLAWHYLEDNLTTEVGYGGGAGSGKSMLGCIWHIYRRAKYPETRGLIGRAKIAILEQSTLVTLFKVASGLGYKAGRDYDYNSQKHIINWNNGSQTILKDLFLYPSDPDFISLGSTEYTDAFIDEAPEITQRAFELVNSRIRWKLSEYSLIPKTLLTCNPSPGWVRERYIKDGNGEIVKLKDYQKYIASLVHDNPDEEFKKTYIAQLEKLTDDYDRLRLLEGDWDIERKGINPFAIHYDRRKHESEEAVFNPQRQIIIRVDFNLEPFAVSYNHFWQDNNGLHWHVFDEGEIDKGSIPAMIDFIKTGPYGRYIHSAKLTGDSMGKRRDLSQRDHASSYKQLLRSLGMSESQLVVPNNPTHANSRADMAYVHVHFPDYKINPKKCPKLCSDMRTVQWDDVKQEIIKRNRAIETQKSDHLDCERYGINTFLSPRIDRHQKTGHW